MMSLPREAGGEVLGRDARCWSLPNCRCNKQLELQPQFGKKQTQSTIRAGYVTPNQSANCVYDNDHRLTALRFSQGSEVRFGYDEGAPQAEQKHFVYEQSPEAETRAKLPTSVRLTIYGEPRVGRDALIVPNVVERSAIEARSILRKAGFQPKLSVGQAAPSKEKNLYVYRQQPRAGESAARGGVVDITIYRTVSESVGRHTEPVPGLRRVATLTGQWKCSCGETWTLTQRGSKITGQEGTSGSIRHITRGAFDGSVVRFSWRTTDGQSGTGVMVPNAEKRQISWTMTLDSTGQSWKGKAQKKP